MRSIRRRLPPAISLPAWGGGGVSFSPADLDDLLLWYKADAITGLSATDPIDAWVDQSVSAINATGVTTTRPTYQTGVINSLPIVRFDGVDDQLGCGNTSPLRYTGGHSWFVAGKHDDTLDAVTQREILFKVGGVGNRGHDLYLQVNGASSNIVGRIAPDGNNLTTVTASLANDAALIAPFIISFIYTPSTSMKIRLNGTEVGSNTTSIAASQYTNNGIDLLIGDGFGKYDGDLAEIIVYDTNLTAPQISQVEAYLLSKYI